MSKNTSLPRPPGPGPGEPYPAGVQVIQNKGYPGTARIVMQRYLGQDVYGRLTPIAAEWVHCYAGEARAAQILCRWIVWAARGGHFPS